MNRKELKQGDYVTRWGFNFTPPTFWERLILTPKWWLRDVSYWFRKKIQTAKHGFPDEESFDFYSHCAKWSLPRLKRFRAGLYSHPTEFSSDADDPNLSNQLYFDFVKDVEVNRSGLDKWKEVLDKIIWSMENHDKLVDPIYPKDYDHRQVVVSVSDSGTVFKAADERPLDWTPVLNHEKRIQEGFDLFGKHFRNLWD
jgi:hypothetical protein